MANAETANRLQIFCIAYLKPLGIGVPQLIPGLGFWQRLQRLGLLGFWQRLQILPSWRLFLFASTSGGSATNGKSNAPARRILIMMARIKKKPLPWCEDREEAVCLPIGG